MAIHVTCPNGHRLKVKDKYAGKKGLCPFCKKPVDVPRPITDEDVIAILGNPAKSANKAGRDDDTSVLDDHLAPRESSSMSLLGGSAVRHTKRCPNCLQEVPYWFATCPQCQAYLTDDSSFT